ncbi:MAG: hypothetical protein VX335_00900 [Pseudomonadota bacterium]|nr:hypothetical protein [Pseudomonadota bacterium]
MAVNETKLMKKIEKTGTAHAISLGCIALGAFFPAPMVIAFLTFLASSMCYESSKVGKEKKSIIPNFGAKDYARQRGVSMGLLDKEEAATNKIIDNICSMKDRHLAMISIGSGMLCGIVLGAVIGCILMAFSWPTVIAATVSFIAAAAVLDYWKESKKDIPKLEQAKVFTSAGKLSHGGIKDTSKKGKEPTFPMLFKTSKGNGLSRNGKKLNHFKTK